LPPVIITIAVYLSQASRGPALAIRLEAEARHLPLLAFVKHFLRQVHEGLRDILSVPGTHLVEQEVGIVCSLEIFNFAVRYAPLIMVLLVSEDHHCRILNICACLYLLYPFVNVGECLAAAQVDDDDKALGPSSYLKSEDAYLK
jgi:hypothetical protein